MTADQAKQLRIGDKVVHIEMGWGNDVTGKPFSATVKSVDYCLFVDDPVVFLTDGGFWRSSQLRKVEEAAEAKGV